MKFQLFSIHIRWINIIFKKLNNNDPFFAVGYRLYRIVREKTLKPNVTFKHIVVHLKFIFFHVSALYFKIMGVQITGVVLSALYFVSCFTVVQPDVVPKLLSSIQDSVAVRNFKDLYNMWDVIIKDGGKHRIEVCMYVPESNILASIETVNVFYTTIGCGIANWMVHILYSE